MHDLYPIKEIWVYALNDICFWFVFPHKWFIPRNNLFWGRSVRNSAMCILAAKATTVGFWTLILCGMATAAEFQQLPRPQQKHYLWEAHEKGIGHLTLFIEQELDGFNG